MFGREDRSVWWSEVCKRSSDSSERPMMVAGTGVTYWRPPGEQAFADSRSPAFRLLN